MRQAVTLAALGGTFVTLVATSVPVQAHRCTTGHPGDRARYLVTSTCVQTYLVDVTLYADSCSLDLVPVDAGLTSATGHAMFDTLDRGGWTFDLATKEEPSDGGAATSNLLPCLVSRPDAGASALDFACDGITVAACQDDPACRGVGACRGTLERRP